MVPYNKLYEDQAATWIPHHDSLGEHAGLYTGGSVDTSSSTSHPNLHHFAEIDPFAPSAVISPGHGEQDGCSPSFHVAAPTPHRRNRQHTVDEFLDAFSSEDMTASDVLFMLSPQRLEDDEDLGNTGSPANLSQSQHLSHDWALPFSNSTLTSLAEHFAGTGSAATKDAGSGGGVEAGAGPECPVPEPPLPLPLLLAGSSFAGRTAEAEGMMPSAGIPEDVSAAPADPALVPNPGLVKKEQSRKRSYEEAICAPVPQPASALHPLPPAKQEAAAAAAAATPVAKTSSGLTPDKAERKKSREKARRLEVNEKFDQLSQVLLEIQKAKGEGSTILNNKVEVLSKAITTIKQLWLKAQQTDHSEGKADAARVASGTEKDSEASPPKIVQDGGASPAPPGQPQTQSPPQGPGPLLAPKPNIVSPQPAQVGITPGQVAATGMPSSMPMIIMPVFMGGPPPTQRSELSKYDALKLGPKAAQGWMARAMCVPPAADFEARNRLVSKADEDGSHAVCA